MAKMKSNHIKNSYPVHKNTSAVRTIGSILSSANPIRASTLWRLFGISSVTLLAACAHAPPAPLAVTPTFAPQPNSAEASPRPLVVGPSPGLVAIAPGPAPAAGGPSAVDAAAIGAAPPPLPALAESLSLEQVTLPAFIKEVFSKALRLTVQIDQPILTRTDLVTLRTGRSLSGAELYRMAVTVLAGYGIGVVWNGSVLRIAPNEALMAQMPALIHSRALPEMPVELRPIFQIVDLHQVSASDMNVWLANAYGSKIRVFAAPKTNAVMIFGLPQDVRAAVEAVHVLDQARLAGRQSLRIDPVYWTAKELAAKLVELLRAEGYDAGISGATETGQANAVTLVPVEANNSLIAFASDRRILNHIRQWVLDLDQPSRIDPSHNIFIYFVQNTTAASLGRIVQSVLGGAQPAVGAPAEAQLEQAGRTQALPAGLGQPGQSSASGLGAAPGASAVSGPARPPTPAIEPLDRGIAAAGGGAGSGPRIVVDTARNALVLVGTAQDYARVRPLLEALDKAPREALIEVTVVELDLHNGSNLGVEWTAVNRIGKGLALYGTGSNVLPTPPGSATGQASSSSAGGLPLGSEGFNFTILNGVGDVRMLLNAFAENSKINVLSTPRILAESGETANIEVGTEVPIVTSQASTNTIVNAGTTGILQSIEYQKTGVLLSVLPVIHSGDRIDLTLSQVVSQALPNTTPGITSPLIQNRTVSTQLSLRDGQTVVVGGLITENRTNDDTGVPFLKDIPGVGSLFRNQTASRDKNELLVFITPYVISNGADAAAITRQFQDQMDAWPAAGGTLHW
jgi:general secretion pathway protein D